MNSFRSEADPFLETTALELADHLIRNGFSAQAANLLVSVINANIHGVSTKTVAALARIHYGEKDWQEAAGLWTIVVGADPEAVEGLVKLSHCLFELDDPNAAANLMNRALTAMSRASENSGSGGIDTLLEAIYQRIYEHFVAGNQEQCEKLLKLYAIPRTYAGNARGAVAVSDDALSDEAITQRIQSALEQWRSRHARCEIDSNHVGVTSGLSDMRVFMVFRQLFFAASNSREHEIPAFFRESAKALGIRFSFFPADGLHARSDTTPEQQYAALDSLLRALRASKPHLILLDELFTMNPPPPFFGRDVLRNVLIEFRKETGCKLVAYYMDPWVSETLRAIEYVSEFVDLVWHQNPGLARESMKCHHAKFFAAPIPYPEGVFRSNPRVKTVSAGFLGSVVSYNYLRSIWCAMIRSRRIPCQLFFASHAQNDSPAGGTIDEYGAFLSRMRIMVNLNARTPKRKIVTGRVWESILAKALLLEEENEEITHYFVPFVHYVPFKNVVELDAYLRFFERHDELRLQIVEEAYAWFQRCYSKERVWRHLFDAAIAGRSVNLASAAGFTEDESGSDSIDRP